MVSSLEIVLRRSDSASDAKLQHLTLYFFVIYCALLTFPQAIKAIVMLTNHPKPEEDFRHRKLFISLILLTTISLVATYAQGAVITVSQFGAQLDMPRAVPAMYEFTKELSIEFFYAGLVLLLAYRGTSSESVSRRWAFGLLLLMVLCSVINAPVSAVATNPSRITASVSLRCICFVAYSVLTALIVFWSVRLRRNSRQTALPREIHLFDSHILSRIVVLILPLLVFRAVFELISLLFIEFAVFGDSVSLTGFRLTSVIVEGTIFFVMNMVALGLGSWERNRGSGQANGRIQIYRDENRDVPRAYGEGPDGGERGSSHKHHRLYSSPSIDSDSVRL